MTMTADERKSWAYDILDTWLRGEAEAELFTAIDELRAAMDDLKGCPHLDPAAGHSLPLDEGEPPCACPEYLFGSSYVRTLDQLAGVIESQADAFIRPAS